MMVAENYFTVETTSLTIPKRGAKAIYAGDKPRKNADGTTSFSMRAPLLLMPEGMFKDEDEVLRKVVDLLNVNAAIFFDSAKPTP
jgi:hypothetical protein